MGSGFNDTFSIFFNHIYVAAMNTVVSVPKELQSLLLTKNIDEWDKLLNVVDSSYTRVNSLGKKIKKK
jgi:hypothetical protein